MENEKQLIDSLKKDLQIDLAEKNSMERIKEKMVSHLNHLINNNFEELIHILYRVDVSEAKLKALLKENSHASAANTIAELIIERQLQKIKTREQFKTSEKKENPGDEKW
ncbi:MAG TPA: hypothetical protein VKR53_20170 [Puia sp.]|nr:hypothetical protein [Puia sp.]